MLPKIVITNNIFNYIRKFSNKKIDSEQISIIEKNGILSIENSLFCSPISVDTIQEVINNSFSQNPTFTSIFIINFDNCSVKIQNLILKTLEETQHKVNYYLLSKSIFGILDTIKSRCSIERENSTESDDFIPPNLSVFPEFLNFCKEQDYAFLTDLTNFLIKQDSKNSIHYAQILNKIKENVNKSLLINDIFYIYNNK